MNLRINSGEKQIDLDGSNAKRYEEYSDGAIGVSIGLKYISNGGIVISPLFGIGRNMFTDDSYEIVPRLGVNVGYRF